MELRQLKSLITLSECGFNVTQAAETMHLVQSAVSQHITRLENELGVVLLVRQGKRMVGLTAAGEQVLAQARKTLANTENILAIGKDFGSEGEGQLRVGTTHTQACYVLPPILREFKRLFPNVDVQMQQGNPQQLVSMVLNDQVDLAFCTEAVSEHSSLISRNCFRWNRSMIAPENHPLLKAQPLSMEKLCEYPLITYVHGFTGSGHFHNSFARLGLKPRVALSAADTDVIKTYVREGFGVGIIASFAYQQDRDTDLQQRNLARLFPWETTHVAYHKDKYLRRYESEFIELLQTGIADNGISILGKL
jgi:LysR family cys regulon transcriptional activator